MKITTFYQLLTALLSKTLFIMKHYEELRTTKGEEFAADKFEALIQASDVLMGFANQYGAAIPLDAVIQHLSIPIVSFWLDLSSQNTEQILFEDDIEALDAHIQYLSEHPDEADPSFDEIKSLFADLLKAQKENDNLADLEGDRG